MVWSGLAQGLGIGFVYVPLAAVTFATLPPALRNEGTAIFSLMRNIGSSIGISVVDDAADAQHADRCIRAWPSRSRPTATCCTCTRRAVDARRPGRAERDGHQAAMIAYNNDFKLMMVLTLCAVPLVCCCAGAASAAKDAAPVVIE